MDGKQIAPSDNIEESILEAIIDKNCHTVANISRKIGIPYHTVRRYLILNELNLKTYHFREKLKGLIEGGKTQKEIAKKLKYNLQRISTLFGEYNLREYYHKKKYEKNKEELKSIISPIINSFTLKEKISMDNIAKKLGYKDRRFVHPQLKKYDLLNYYHENKEKVEALKKKFKQVFYNTLFTRPFPKINPAEKDALIVYFTGGAKKHPLEFYIDVFQGYYDGLSISKTAKNLGKWPYYIKQLWDRRGLKSHYKGGRRKK